MRQWFKIWLMMLACWAGTLGVSAQQEVTSTTAGSTVVSREAELLFNSLVPQRDSTYLNLATQKDRFGKRFSLHFNMLDWALTLPSVGIEFDLDKTKKNNRSLMLVGKYNPHTTHSHTPQVVFDVTAARLEFRKYWRTGSIGQNRLNHNYERIRLSRPQELTRTEFMIDGFDTIPYQVNYYRNYEDSLLAEQYNGDASRGWFYNHYYKFRRNVTSSRTLRTPRNWRAYYLGAYLGADKWDLCLNKQGKKGSGVYAGMTLGWTIPVLTRRFPSEGGLDLDLGALVGLKAVKYDAYKYVSDKGEYQALPAESKPSWSLVKWPVVQELRLSFVYRFRSISRKVSLALVDDYQSEWVEPFRSRKQQAEMDRINAVTEKRTQDLQQHRQAIVDADSTAFWNSWHERRLRNAMRINPDTIFVGADDTLAHKLIKELNIKPASKSVSKDAEKELQKQAKDAEKELQKQAKDAEKELQKQAKDAEKAAKEAAKQAVGKSAAKADKKAKPADEEAGEEADVMPVEKPEKKSKKQKDEPVSTAKAAMKRNRTY